MSLRRLIRLLALLLSLSLWHCRQATDPEPAPPAPAPAPTKGPGTLILEPDQVRPRTGIDFRGPDSTPPGPRIGGGSQTETLTGLALSPSGERLPGIRVKLFPSAYDPSHPDTTVLRQAVTDDSGRFAFSRLDTAAFYNLIAGAPAERLWAFAESLQTRPVERPLSLRLAATVLVDLHTGTAYSTRDSGIAFFPGTDILARCDGRTTAKVDSIPYGLQRLILRSRAGWPHRVVLPSGIDTVRISANPTDVQLRYRPQ